VAIIGTLLHFEMSLNLDHYRMVIGSLVGLAMGLWVR